MQAGSAPPTETLTPYTFATWVFTLHVAGVRAADPQVAEACEAVLHASDPKAGNAAGEQLVSRVRELLASGEVSDAARRLYGDRVRGDLGEGDRDSRTTRIRRYQFAAQLPWLARIWERANGEVRPGWLLVERVTDEVTAADPNPWNDVDEVRHLSVHDFHVLWELDGCSNVYVAV
jgi:hypothetical protein